MTAIVPRSYLAQFGGEQGLADAVVDFAAALEAHALTVDVPAPTAHPLVDEIVRRFGGQYEVEAEPEPEPEPLPTVADVKAEAGRRIEAIMPDYKQRNVMAWGLETMMAYGTDTADWPAPLQAVNNQAQAAWAAIKVIRVRSDEIEAMSPIPADFRDDSYWTA